MFFLPERELILETPYTEKEVFDRLRPHIRRNADGTGFFESFDTKYFVGMLLHNAFKVKRPRSLHSYLVTVIEGEVTPYLSKSRIHVSFAFNSTMQIIVGCLVSLTLALSLAPIILSNDGEIEMKPIISGLYLFGQIYVAVMASFLFDFHQGRKLLVSILHAKVVDPDSR